MPSVLINPVSMLDDIIWKCVPSEITRLVKAAAGTYSVLQDVIQHLPNIDAKVWYYPDLEKVAFCYPVGTDSDNVAKWHIALKQVPGVENVSHGFFYLPQGNKPFVRIKQAKPLMVSDLFSPVAHAAQWKENALNKLWGGPNPLVSTIAGGLLGAGLGYGGGWLAEQLLPEDKFEKGKLRRTTALMGGLTGAVPGLWTALDSYRNHPEHKGTWRSLIAPYPPPTEAAAGTIHDAGEKLAESLSEVDRELNEQFMKYADEAGTSFAPAIPVDQFNRVIWNDLRSAGGFTPAPLAATTTGLVQAASLSRGVDLVSPADIARIGVGMGSGYLSGMLVGKTLGALAGLRPEAQQQLQQAGTWAGILSNVVPMLFR